MDLKQLTSDEIIERAYEWLCQQRQDYSANNDVWELRRNWRQEKLQLQQQLLAGDYQFSPLQQYRFADEMRNIWCARDALVLKALAIVMQREFKHVIPLTCTHIAGHGGSKAAVRKISSETTDYDFAIRTDVKSYYASIDHFVLFNMLGDLIADQNVLRLLWQYLKYTTTYGGLYWDNERGISLGCPLSPWIGAFYLVELDEAMAKLPVVYQRFMDDWVILAKTRWQLKKAISVMNRLLEKLKLKKHPDKTFIGRTKQGFQFLGYWITQKSMTIAKSTIQNAKQKAARLYEQGASNERIGEYWRHWWGWVCGGVDIEAGKLPHGRPQEPAPREPAPGGPLVLLTSSGFKMDSVAPTALF